MTKQTDRLLILEENQKFIKRDVMEIKKMLGDYISKAQDGRIDCTKMISSNATQTKFQWAVIGSIFLGMIGMWFKK